MIVPLALLILPPVMPNWQRRSRAVSLPGGVQKSMSWGGLQRKGDSQHRRPIGDTCLAALKCCAVVVLVDAADEDAADDLVPAAGHAGGVGYQWTAEG